MFFIVIYRAKYILVLRYHIFDLCGVKTFYRRTFSIVVTSTAAERQGWLAEVAATVNHYFPRDNQG